MRKSKKAVTLTIVMIFLLVMTIITGATLTAVAKYNSIMLHRVEDLRQEVAHLPEEGE